MATTPRFEAAASPRPASPVSAILAMLAMLVSLSGCDVSGIFGVVDGVSVIGTAQTVVPQRFPVVALIDDAPAQVVSIGRENDDPTRAVQQFASAFDLTNETFSTPASLAAPDASDFVASGRPELPGFDNTLAADRSGQIWALWWGSANTELDLYVNRYSGGWGTKTLLAQNVSGDIADKRIATDGQRGALVVWHQTAGNLSGRVFDNASGWGPTVTVVLNRARRLGDIVRQGDATYASWADADETLFVSRLGAGVWQPPQRLGTLANGAHPTIATHPAANAAPLIVWQAPDGIRTNWLGNAGPRLVDSLLIPGSEGGAAPRAVMAANGEVLVTWSTPLGGRSSRYANGLWSDPVPGGGGGSLAALVGDAAGNAVVVWASGQSVRARRYIVGAGWQEPITLAEDLAGGNPDVAMDDNGRAVAVWEAAAPVPGNDLATKVVAKVITGPVAAFSATPNPAPVGATVSFDGGGSSAAVGPIARYEWDFGDDGIIDASGPTATRIYDAAGTYAVRLRVFDNQRLYADSRQQITVSNTTVPLTVQVAGSSGRVTSSAGAIDCSTDNVGQCQADLPAGSDVTLTATPDAGSEFLGWSGDPDCDNGALTMLAPRACLATFQMAAAPAGWATLGEPLAVDTNQSIRVGRSIKRSGAGDIYVAFRENALIYVQHFDGTRWTTLGGTPVGTNPDSVPALALDPLGRPCVVFELRTPQQGIDVETLCWTGGAWDTLGRPADVQQTARLAREPAIAIDTQGRAVVAWREGGAIHVRRREPNGPWADLGGSITTGANNASLPRLALSPIGPGQPTVAWVEGQQAHAATWDGAAWVMLGTDTNGIVGDGLRIDVAIDSSGAAIVATGTWGQNTVIVRRWDGSAWSDLGRGLNSGAASIRIADVAIDTANGTAAPMVAWGENGLNLVFAARQDGTNWQLVDAAVTNPRSGYPELVGVVAGATSPLVMVTNFDGRRDIVVRRHGGP